MLVGIIYDVLSNRVYYSINGSGVFFVDISNIYNIYQVIKSECEIDNIKKAVISYDMPYSEDAFKVTSKMITELYLAGASLKTVGPISLDILKTALGKENRPNDYNNAVWHMEVRAWDVAASTAILRELGGEIISKDGNPLTLADLTNPTKTITFFASRNYKLLEKLYSIYKKI